MLSLFACVLAKELNELPLTMTWEEWSAEFGVEPNPMSSAKEVAFRKETYEANLKKIKQHNEKGTSWEMGINRFSDLTDEEFQELMGLRACRRVMSDERESKSAKTFRDLVANGREPTLRDARNAPSVDWRTTANPRATRAVVEVKNQGQCGSCWSFSTTGAAEGAWALSGKTLTSLSEQMLVSCDHQGANGCSGGWMDAALEWIKGNGIASEADYPYVSGRGFAPSCDRRKTSELTIPAGAIEDVVEVRSNSEAALENALNVGPVSVCVNAPPFANYRRGVFSSPCSADCDHGVLAVGYTAEYWVVKNSWGSQWGDSGYIKFARGMGNICGILSRAAYPVLGSSPIPPTPTPPTPTPPTPTPPTPTPSGDCHAISPVATDAWCQANCHNASPNCPSDLCKCDA